MSHRLPSAICQQPRPAMSSNGVESAGRCNVPAKARLMRRCSCARRCQIIRDLHVEHVSLLIPNRTRLVEKLARHHHMVLSRHWTLAKGAVVPRGVTMMAMLQQSMVLGGIEQGPADHPRHSHLLLLLCHDKCACHSVGRSLQETTPGDLCGLCVWVRMRASLPCLGHRCHRHDVAGSGRGDGTRCPRCQRLQHGERGETTGVLGWGRP